MGNIIEQQYHTIRTNILKCSDGEYQKEEIMQEIKDFEANYEDTDYPKKLWDFYFMIVEKKV